MQKKFQFVIRGNEPGHFFPGRIRDSNRILTSFRIDEYNRKSQRKLNRKLFSTEGTGSASAIRLGARTCLPLFFPGKRAACYGMPNLYNKIAFLLLLYCTFVLFKYIVPSFIVVVIVKSFNLPVIVVLVVRPLIHVITLLFCSFTT